jgi:hypothetical protein
MEWPLTERIADLRREVRVIQDDSQTYFACRKPSADRTLLQQRRVERLKQIKDELDHLLRIHRRGAA